MPERAKATLMVSELIKVLQTILENDGDLKIYHQAYEGENKIAVSYPIDDVLVEKKFKRCTIR